MENHPRYRSLFWPILLVGVGIAWLLSNLGIIQPINIGSLLKLWPVLLIVLGLDILFSRRYPWVGALVGFLAIGGVIAFLIASPTLGIDAGPQTKTETFNTPINKTMMVEYLFETSSAPVEIKALENSKDLISAEITHRGNMRFDVTGSISKSIHLSEISDNSTWFSWDLSFDNLKWDIGLAPAVASTIILDGGSGSINMDLTGILVSSLRTDLGSGSSHITLPVSITPYTVKIESGSGSVRLQLPEKTDVEMTLDSGSGSMNISIPHGAALRIEVMDEGSGSLNLPDGLVKSTDSKSFSIGAWQTANYEKAVHKIVIKIINQGSGSLTINEL
ncbi:MAG: hypothetical protein FD147_1928 [Chloroflexi bacterium]|nr:MAG: hypothetical protein FD147_1928 [Chloroflexota bacterium]